MLALRYTYHTIRAHITCRVPYVGSYRQDLTLLTQKFVIKPGSTICDLGCGDGKALRHLCDHYQLAQADGYDLHLPAIKRGQFLSRKKHPQIKLQQQDFFQADISTYDYIYCFLLPEMMNRVEEWLATAASPHTTIIVSTFPCTQWLLQLAERIQTPAGKDKIFIYKKIPNTVIKKVYLPSQLQQK